ncbi:hypothetical protein C211_09668 [Stutzerimonas degradans]|nr:hypothetical protein C211_09668 [Stutzerimonas degradans]
MSSRVLPTPEKEDDTVRLAASGQHALQFTARNDVEARAQARQYVQYAQVRIGFDGEADQMRHAIQRIGIGPVLGFDVRAGIDVGRCAEALRERGQRHALREELTVAVREGLHDQPPLEFETVFGTFFGGGLVVRQIQRAFLAAAAENGGENGERDKGKQQTLHGGQSLKNRMAGVYPAPGGLPIEQPRRRRRLAWVATGLLSSRPRCDRRSRVTLRTPA